MEQTTLFLSLNTKVKVNKEVIVLKDIAKIYCLDSAVSQRINEMEIYRFKKQDEGRCVITVLKVISLIQKMEPQLTLNSLGDTQVIVEQVKEKKIFFGGNRIKIAVVASLCFFGTMFTTMAYHNDISILSLFERIKRIIGKDQGERVTLLEIAYSVGLSVGIIVFYNHIGKRKLTKDPTPIAVEMRTYEAEINQSLVELAEREGKTIDVS